MPPKNIKVTMNVDIAFQADTPLELTEQIAEIKSALAAVGIPLTAAPDIRCVVNGKDETQNFAENFRLPVIKNAIENFARNEKAPREEQAAGEQA